MKSKVFFLFTALVIAACVPFGPRDGYLEVAGVAPSKDAAECWVAVEPLGGTSAGRKAQVSGTFKVPFVVNTSRLGHKAELSCGGEVISARTFNYGQDVDIGGTVVLPGTAP